MCFLHCCIGISGFITISLVFPPCVIGGPAGWGDLFGTKGYIYLHHSTSSPVMLNCPAKSSCLCGPRQNSLAVSQADSVSVRKITHIGQISPKMHTAWFTHE